MPKKDTIYRSNPNLKAAYTPIKFTVDQVTEWIKCRDDIVYFGKNYMKIVNVDKGLMNFDLWPFQEDLVRTFQDERFVIAKFPRQVGKALKLTTKILTPSGWTTMGELSVGDTIYGRNGEETKVTFVSEIHHRDTYDITFDNGETVTACEDHLWTVSTSDWEHREKTLSTKELIPLLGKKQKNGSGLYTSVADALPFQEQSLPIDPYVLGVWLGDGNSRDGRVTTSSVDLIPFLQKIASCGFDIECIRKDKRKGKNTYRYRIDGLRTLLRKNDLLLNKHIPEIYLRSSVEQRLELLRGLMDTDGHARKNGGCEFYNKNLRLIEGVRFILSSLGIKSRVGQKIIKGQLYHTVRFATTKYIVFCLQRKVERQRLLKNKAVNKRHYIQSIVKVETVPTVCIQVDSRDHMFLCGETLIPTHNTTCSILYLVHTSLFFADQKIAILANKSSTAQAIMAKFQLAYEHLPKWLQQGVIEWNKRSVLLENNNSIIADATGGSAIRGGSFNVIFLDEFAFVHRNIAEEFFASVYPTISSGNTSKVIIVSTPNGMNLFYKLWVEAENGQNRFVPKAIHWRDVPGRDSKWEAETRANLGDALFDQEFNCEFLGSSNTLISAKKLRELALGHKIYEADGLDIYYAPEAGHQYVITVDVARGQSQDYSAFSVIDVTEMPYVQVAKFRSKDISTLLYPSVIYDVATKYGGAWVLIETNDIGGQIADLLYVDYEYENLFRTHSAKTKHVQVISAGHVHGSILGVRTTASTKAIGCSNLKTLVEQNQLIINDFETISELTTFVATKASFAAEPGANDDLAMTLVMFGWLTTQQFFKDLTDTNVRDRICALNQDAVNERMLPFGYFDNGLGSGNVMDIPMGSWTAVEREEEDSNPFVFPGFARNKGLY